MRILLADDEQISREMMADYLEGLLGHEVVQCDNGKEALEKFKEEPFRLVVSDIKMPVMNGNELLHEIKQLPEGKDCVVVLITGYAELDSAVQAVRDGAFDYLRKPIDIEQLDSLIVNIQNVISNNDKPEEEDDPAAEGLLENGSFIDVAGKFRMGVFSAEMKEVISLAMKLHNEKSVPVLIEGESGTGKELIANLVHHGKGSSGEDKPLVSINCSAISSSLFESELFGFEGGSFTGAKSKGQMGKIELAAGGTLFLDEIGDMPLELQPKLLRVIQDKKYYRVGGLEEINADVRIIAATNRDLSKLVEKGTFRKDLFHRLNTGWIRLPALSGQPESIAPMAQMFLNEFSKEKGKKFKIISSNAVKLLREYSWPGNIRELRNVIERVTILYDEIELRPKHLGMLDVDKDIADDSAFILDTDNFSLPDKEKFSLRDINTVIIRKALEKFNGNQTQAAKYLGISRGTLRNKLG